MRTNGILLCGLFAAFLALSFLLGCGAPTKDAGEKGTTEAPAMETAKPGTVVFNSMPLGVQVYIDGVLKGNTPLTLQLEDGKKFKVEFKDEEHGYETETKEIDNKAGTINVSLRKKRD
jgi:predicted DNA-binding antitoxin AbrB/MazE fold protein